MYLNLYRLTILISIIQLRYDNRQEKLLIHKEVIAKSTKIELKCCRGGGLNLCPPFPIVFVELEIVKVPSPKHYSHGAVQLKE